MFPPEDQDQDHDRPDDWACMECQDRRCLECASHAIQLHGYLLAVDRLPDGAPVVQEIRHADGRELTPPELDQLARAHFSAAYQVQIRRLLPGWMTDVGNGKGTGFGAGYGMGWGGPRSGDCYGHGFGDGFAYGGGDDSGDGFGYGYSDNEGHPGNGATYGYGDSDGYGNGDGHDYPFPVPVTP